MYTAKFEINGQELILETGRMAKQANGAVIVRLGGSEVLATACCSSEPKEGLDFVPVTVEYNEKYYAAGKIPGGFLKREARPKDKEILVSRLIDRPMRPLFYKAFSRELQVVPTVVSTDQINPPDILGMIGAFAAVMISDIPFNGPVGAVRVALVNDEYVINPTFDQIDESVLDIVVGATNDGICMVEGGGKEVSEDQMLGAISKAEEFLKDFLVFMQEFQDACGKEKLGFHESALVLENSEAMEEYLSPLIEEASFVKGKFERLAALKEVKNAAAEKFAENITDETKPLFSKLFNEIEKKIMRAAVIEKQLRCDGRDPKTIRAITSEIGILAKAHGSALFTRGETQSLGVVTLGSALDEQILDNIDGDKRERFMLHYNFPPYSVGEVGRLMTGRREIGHGHLAFRALEPVLPPKDIYPYTIRIVSEILESNGSSSQATICSGSLSMLAAGVPIKSPVAGIAMGLIKEGDKFQVLSDILGEEDHMGDMDFKVAGTKNGITAFQMDIKISGISKEVMTVALNQAHEGRLHILERMNSVISEPSDNIPENVPKTISFKVPTDKIGMIIGPGGKNIKGLSEKYTAKVNIEESGLLTIFAATSAQAEACEADIRGMVEDPEAGNIYTGKVTRLTDFGAFIEILPGKEGLCHISKIAKERVQKVSDALKEGQEVKVRLIEVDRMGRLNLSIVDADNPDWKPQRTPSRPPRPQGDRPQRK
ncbi:polyribonucleotide nucleotidyltransferase [Thiospirochaeta perfilievii]|uniref:Polyribonucleotide nucleotidyltransferase n=1 Tax=Thiospirochaeta perfilievii TaxID=252967 RepID=A0A5C1QFU6_9SPIO|nr:polyribonucleotide nucleotidyltransferase [Thiospirochaeta perfilievii]QEN06238.1 polyribonucleotide nucleotidyltransferase [Thiospirochaeta perfilievii]